MVFSLAKIGPREKLWIVLWVGVVSAVLAYRVVHHPRAQMVREVREKVEALEDQKISLMAKQPDLNKRREAIERLKQQIAARYEKLVVAEEELVDLQDTDTLLESLVKDRSQFEMYLNAVRPLQQKDSPPAAASGPGGRPQGPEPYRRLLVQLDLYGTFQGLASYIQHLEQMRPYQEVQGVKVKVEGKEVSRPHAVVVVAVVMGHTLKEKEERRQEVFAVLEEVVARETKDPFLTADRPKEVSQASGLELSGVFSEGGKPVAAMINNQIYRMGEMVQGKRIVSIEENRVFLEHGNRRFVVLPGQPQGKEGQ